MSFKFLEMIQKTHDRPQRWRSILAITVGSLLSVALYALLCWGVNCTDLKSQWHSRRMYVGIAWVVMTVFLLRKQLRAIPNENRYRMTAYFFFGLSIGCGLLVIDQYVHRATSSYHHCKSITRESIGDAEYIMSEQGLDVMENCRGYDVGSSRMRKGRVRLRARVVAPIKDSHGVYWAFDESVYYETKWKSRDEQEKAYHEALTKLQEKVSDLHHDKQCYTYRRIFAYNKGSYSQYVNAVENSSQYLNDSLYNVEALPPIIESIHDVGLGADARPNVLFSVLYLVIHFFICVAILMAQNEE